jgi:hypothetical protein
LGIHFIDSTLCGGCETEHTTFVITPPEAVGCACCADANTETCCTNDSHSQEESHSTKSVYAQLKELVSEHKSKSVKWVVPEIAIFVLVSQITSKTTVTSSQKKSIETESPPVSGRTIITLLCILRN